MGCEKINADRTFYILGRENQFVVMLVYVDVVVMVANELNIMWSVAEKVCSNFKLRILN